MRFTFLAILIACTPFFAQAQDKVKIKPSFDGAVNIGYSIFDELLPEGYYYNPQTLLGAVDLWKRKRYSLYSELQLVRAYDNLNLETDIEFGVNLGFMITQKIFKHLQLAAAIGVGPHFITVETSRQANGFIFSDNVELGLSYESYKLKTSFNLKLRYRHISNAGLQKPNGGLDNLFLILGVTRNFKKV